MTSVSAGPFVKRKSTCCKRMVAFRDVNNEKYDFILTSLFLLLKKIFLSSLSFWRFNSSWQLLCPLTNARTS